MHGINSLNDLSNDYPDTFRLLKVINPDYYEFADDGQVVILHFEPKRRLLLTINEIAAMNHPSFRNLLQSTTKPALLKALEEHFGKSVWD